MKITNVLAAIKTIKTGNEELVLGRIYATPSNILEEDYHTPRNDYRLNNNVPSIELVAIHKKYLVFFPYPDDGDTTFCIKKGAWKKRVKPLKNITYVRS